jgi:hypothetical protein
VGIFADHRQAIEIMKRAEEEVSSASAGARPAAIAALSNCMRCVARLKIEGARVAVGRQGMDASLFIGAPLGFGILLALGILMVAVSYLSQ